MYDTEVQMVESNIVAQEIKISCFHWNKNHLWFIHFSLLYCFIGIDLAVNDREATGPDLDQEANIAKVTVPPIRLWTEINHQKANNKKLTEWWRDF